MYRFRQLLLRHNDGGAAARSQADCPGSRSQSRGSAGHGTACARRFSLWFAGSFFLLLVGAGCESESRSVDLATTIGALEDRVDLGEYADNHELRLKFDLPSETERPASSYHHGRIRLLAAEGGVELSVRDLNQEVRPERRAVFIAVPKSFDEIDAILELELVDEAGSKVTMVRRVPRGYARALPQRPFRSRETNAAAPRSIVHVLDKDYGVDGGGVK